MKKPAPGGSASTPQWAMTRETIADDEIGGYPIPGTCSTKGGRGVRSRMDVL
jgi:hypothetical protein